MAYYIVGSVNKEIPVSQNTDIPAGPCGGIRSRYLMKHKRGRDDMIADQWNRICPEQMKTNPVLTYLKPFFTKLALKTLITGMLLCVQVLPVNAASDIHREATMENGIVHSKVSGSVESAWNKLLLTLDDMKAPVFSKVDHKANALSVGLDMKQARVVSFGNPAVGTFLMQENPEAALDLPLKILVWESPEGTMLSWNDPAWIARRYGISPDNETVRKMQKMFEIISGKMQDTH